MTQRGHSGRMGNEGLTTIEYEEDTPALKDHTVKNVVFAESAAKGLAR